MMIILLDGSKGAGKTTAGEDLRRRLKNVVYLSLDNERRALGHRGSLPERNREAFEEIIKKCQQYIDKGTNLIIDCGLLKDRISRIDALAKNKGVKVYKFLLKASYETQLDRVRARDKSKGKKTDEERFAEVHTLIHSKAFDDFVIIETDKASPAEVVSAIERSLSKKEIGEIG